MRALFAPVLLVLAACTGPAALTPEARCFAEATVDYRAQWRRAKTARADLDRGYALTVQSLPVASATDCSATDNPADCLVNERRRIVLPVAIDPTLTRARLARAEARMDALRPVAMAAAAPCGYGSWDAAWRAAQTD